MKDYEQLYYDLRHEMLELTQKISMLEQELDIYKSIQKNKDLKVVIVNEILKYKRRNNDD